MKKYLIASRLNPRCPSSHPGGEAFYLMVDNTTNQCRVMPGSELTSTNKARYKELGKYATIDEAKAAMDSCSEVLPKTIIEKKHGALAADAGALRLCGRGGFPAVTCCPLHLKGSSRDA